MLIHLTQVYVLESFSMNFDLLNPVKRGKRIFYSPFYRPYNLISTFCSLNTGLSIRNEAEAAIKFESIVKVSTRILVRDFLSLLFF